MTLDEKSESTSTTSSSAARKPRRRVTRSAGTPKVERESQDSAPQSNDLTHGGQSPIIDEGSDTDHPHTVAADGNQPQGAADIEQPVDVADATDAAEGADGNQPGEEEKPVLDVLAELADFATHGDVKKPKAKTSNRGSRKKSQPQDVAEPRESDGKESLTTDAIFSAIDQALETKAQRRRPASAPIFAAPVTPVADEEEDEDTAEVVTTSPEIRLPATTLLFQAPDVAPRARKKRSAQRSADVLADTDESHDLSDHDDKTDSGEVTVTGQDIPEVLEVDGEDIISAGDEDRDGDEPQRRRRRRRGGRGRRKQGTDDASDDVEEVADGESSSDDTSAADEVTEADAGASAESDPSEESSTRRRRRRRRSSQSGTDSADGSDSRTGDDQVVALKGSTRLEAKRQRRREGRDAGRRRQVISEAEFLARRESVDRAMVVRERNGRTQIAVLEDGVLVEHYVSQQSQASMAGNVYLGRVQNVLPSMEAAFVDIGKGRNAVLYAGEVNWDAAGLAEGQPRRIEQALKPGDTVLVQVTKDPIGQKGARLTSQVTLAGRYLVFVPSGGMTGISRKLPDTERNRLKKLLREIVPEGAGVIVRTAAEGASEEELRADISRLEAQWQAIEKKSKSAHAPSLLQGEPDMAIRVVRDIFNGDFNQLIVSGKGAYDEISSYIHELAADLEPKLTKWTSNKDVFAQYRIDEQLAKGMDRKVWLPSGGSLVIDRTEAMTVIDVNTGKFTGSGGTLEETVTRNNLEAAEEIVRQLRLRDIGGIVVVDFIDMVLESNRDLVLRRLVECLGRDRTKHQVAEVTSLGLVQMTRKRVGQGLVEAFSETCTHCLGRGFIVHSDPIERGGSHSHGDDEPVKKSRRRKNSANNQKEAEVVEESGAAPAVPVLPDASSKERAAVKATLARIADAAAHAHEHDHEHELEPAGGQVSDNQQGEQARQEPSAPNAQLAAQTQGAAEQSSQENPSATDAQALAEPVAASENGVDKDERKAPGKNTASRRSRSRRTSTKSTGAQKTSVSDRDESTSTQSVDQAVTKTDGELSVAERGDAQANRADTKVESDSKAADQIPATPAAPQTNDGRSGTSDQPQAESSTAAKRPGRTSRSGSAKSSSRTQSDSSASETPAVTE